MWIMYEPEESADRLVRMPKFAFVQEVYEEKDWSSLLIPGITPAKAKTPKNNKAVRQAVNAFLAN
jgi:hypothetical protein